MVGVITAIAAPITIPALMFAIPAMVRAGGSESATALKPNIKYLSIKMIKIITKPFQNAIFLLNTQNLVKPIPTKLNSYIHISSKCLTSSTSTSFLSKQRPNKKKTKKISLLSPIPSFKVKAYATADYYDLDNLKESILNSKAYECVDIPNTDEAENFLCIKPKYQEINEIEPRHIFFFEDGSVVFWNLSNEEQHTILEMIEKHEENAYPIDTVEEESEVMNYSRIKFLFENSDEIKNDGHKEEADTSPMIRFNEYFDPNSTRLKNNQIFFAENKDHILEKYSFSDAMALSVKLGVWEKTLDQFTEKIEYISDDLRRGKKLKLEGDEILKYLGELFTMRHVVNLHSNFLDTPDFYWDREKLEILYSQMYSHLSIAKRTRLFNERLNHCIDLMEILKQHLSDNKHTRLEWIIIGLITIEVMTALGVLDFVKNLSLASFDYLKSFGKNK
ncbi:unnamed protein product [Brachionus calyciflorus]|uniref:DUF155 domain-containing protein n=1 Tax=Brachionus calyciflorus TaxID=104777 RepID=A0A813MFB3_9BILA|nr:unnamed protein product [Brachionus calyciflorus]